MQTFFNRLFGVSQPKPVARSTGKSAGKSAARKGRPSQDNPLTIEDGSENATRRELVQVLLRDVLRRSGIPPEWIDCQMLLVSSRSRGHGMYVRLILKHWDHRLMNYVAAFEQALVIDIERFEPRSSQWLHGVSWQLEMGESCPYTELPDKSFWLETAKKSATPNAAAAAPAMEPAPSLPERAGISIPSVFSTPPTGSAAKAATAGSRNSDNPAKDLEQLFAIRDRELEQLAADGLMPVGYEKTQPSPL